VDDHEANQKRVIWRQDPSLRMQVVYWIISSATFELHAEKVDPKQQGVVYSTTTSITTMDLVRLPELDPSVFPLGFSTGDEQVDHILTILRMDLLHQIEQEQQQYNQLLADSILLETSSSSRRDKEPKTMSTKKSSRQREQR
jgi:hypothetical protein